MYDAIVYDGVADALDALAAAGCRLFVATAKPHYYARPILERFDLARHFAAIHGPELDGTNDHKADLIAHIIAREGVRPERGHHDRRPRVRRDRGRPATAFRTIGVTWGYGSRGGAGSSAGAAALCDAPAELAAAVLALPNA